MTKHVIMCEKKMGAKRLIMTVYKRSIGYAPLESYMHSLYEHNYVCAFFKIFYLVLALPLPLVKEYR